MLKKLLITAALLAAGIVAAPAQQAANGAPALYRNTYTHLGGVFVTPVAGVPFSATVTIENQKPLPDGSMETLHTINLIGRDNRGRIHGENRRMEAESFQGMPPLMQVHIFNPETRLNTNYDLGTHIARQQVLPEPRSNPSQANSPNPLVQMKDLGTAIIDHIEVKGTLRTLTIPAEANATGAALTVVDEYWYSEDLNENLLLRHSDPRTGVQTITLSKIKREAPPEEFFEVPEGYRIVDMTPVAPAPKDDAVAGGSNQ
jgi:hypothetical protein